MNETAEFKIIFVTVPDLETGRRLSNQLLTHKLAACINIIPGLESHYIWDSQIQFDHELLLMIKTTSTCFDALRDMVQRHHPYDTPEIVSVPIVDGSQDYLSWIAQQTKA